MKVSSKHYSSDYKSANAIDAVTKTLIEPARLRDAVIETALRLRRSALALQKFWSGQDEGAPHAAMEIDELADELVKAREAFDAAADALIEFEASHAKGARSISTII